MTEAELIQSAAKAVGFLYDPNLTAEDGSLVGRYRTETGPSYVWNPLTGLSDAINMASVIQIKLEFIQDRVWAHYGTGTHESAPLSMGTVQATCKVLTNIAAEVGKQFL